MNSVVFYCLNCKRTFVGEFYQAKDRPRCPQCNKKTVSTGFHKEQWVELSKEARKKVTESLTAKEAFAKKRFYSIASFVDNHIVTIRNVRILLVVALVLFITQFILELSQINWEIVTLRNWPFFLTALLSIVSYVYKLRYTQKIKNEPLYSRFLMVPIVIVLVNCTIGLCNDLEALKWYTENPWLYRGTWFQWFMFYIINLGPNVMGIVAFLLAGLFALLKRKKSFLVPIFIGSAAIVSVASSISLIIRAAEVYLQNFGVVSVLQLIINTVASIVQWGFWIMLLMPPLLTSNIALRENDYGDEKSPKTDAESFVEQEKLQKNRAPCNDITEDLNKTERSSNKDDTAEDTVNHSPKEICSQELLFCRKCGTRILTDSIYCYKCGTQVEYP